MRIKFRRTGIFRKNLLQESIDRLRNPGCGWYHIYTFSASPPIDGRPVEEEVWLDEACREESLALVLINIGEFRTGDIAEEALGHVSAIFDFFHRNQKQMILRLAYDTEGKGMEREPLTLATVKRHMEQLGGIVRKYTGDILVMQGLFVGNWGEMHGSKFLDDSSLCELADTLYRVTEGKCFLAVRNPVQWRKIVGSAGKSGLRERLALFNDGMFGSDTDLGTYGVTDRAQAGETGNWSRQEELDWQKEHLAHVPNGGEAIADAVCVGYQQASEEMCRMYTGYLNGVYHPEQLAYWRRETVEGAGCWSGVSGYDYIGRHLGYRFVVREAAAGRGKELYIEIENCGFGNLCQEADCFLEVEEAEGTIWNKRLDTDPRKWMRGEVVRLSTGFFFREKNAKGSKIYLILRRRFDGQAILFANQGAGEKFQIGEFPDFQDT